MNKIFCAILLFTVSICVYSQKETDKIVKTKAQWRKQLTPQQYHVTREKGTERAFSGPFYKLKKNGIYSCICCDTKLFSSKEKYDSGTGWPSFWKPIKNKNIIEKSDNSFFMKRTEVLCNKCDAHLGHVFDDGPKPTGLRYCINSVALRFIEIKNVNRKDPKATTKAILQAYKFKDLKALANLSNRVNQKFFSQIAAQGEKHPRYKSIFRGWRWQAVKSWDGKLKQVRYRGKKPRVSARAHFANISQKEIAVVTLEWEENKWCFEDIHSPSKNSFLQSSLSFPKD